MSFTFNPASTDDAVLQIARVRNHVNDIGNGTEGGGVEGEDYFLSDARIKLYLGDETDASLSDVNIARLAAAAALDTLATNEAYVQKVQKTLGDETDGAKGADAIRAHAASLRKIVAQARDRANAQIDGSYSKRMRRDEYCEDEYARPHCHPRWS